MNISFSEHVFLLFSSIPQTKFSIPMNMSQSCVLRRIICTSTRADRLIVAGNADSFLSGLSVSHAHSHSFVCSSFPCTALFLAQCPLIILLSALFHISALTSLICDSLIVCFCFIPFISLMSLLDMA